MTDKEGAGVTVISHETENRTHGDYERYVTYTGVFLIQLEALTDVSARCEQCISYEFLNSRLLEGGKAWWVSRARDEKWITGVVPLKNVNVVVP